MLQSQALQVLEQKISACKKCAELCEYRSNHSYKTVAGQGHVNARIMVLGEAPGVKEVEQGKPFVGKSGIILTNILQDAGIGNEHVFVTNMLKCRPPQNRDPFPEELSNCRRFLEMQIKIVNPEWILCFGRISSVHLLCKDKSTSISSLRRKVQDYEGRKVICTFHPSYLLRNPKAKKLIRRDLQPVIAAIQERADNGLDLRLL